MKYVAQATPPAALKEIISQTDYYLVSLSSKTYVFEDKMTKYWSVWLAISFCSPASAKLYFQNENNLIDPKRIKIHSLHCEDVRRDVLGLTHTTIQTTVKMNNNNMDGNIFMK